MSGGNRDNGARARRRWGITDGARLRSVQNYSHLSAFRRSPAGPGRGDVYGWRDGLCPMVCARGTDLPVVMGLSGRAHINRRLPRLSGVLPAA